MNICTVLIFYLLSFHAFTDDKKREQENKPTIVVTSSTITDDATCWATLYDEANLKGENITVYNDIDLSNMNFPDGSNWTGRIKSIEVGPKASLKLYGEENFQDSDHLLGPGVKQTSFNPLPHNQIESLKLTCL